MLFGDPEEPSRGLFYNRPTSWTCEGVNSQKLKVYELRDSYANFRAGAGLAISLRQSILFYYWSPTLLVGRYTRVQREEPPFDQKDWESQIDPNPIGTRSLPAKISISVSRALHAKAPQLIELFLRVEIPLPLFNSILAKMAEHIRMPPRCGGVLPRPL